MTRARREYLKARVDAATRLRVSVMEPDGCKECGCNLDVYVDDCRTCWARRYNRERRGRTPKTTCSGCGGPKDSFAKGCRHCYNRDRQRRAA